MSDFWKRKLRTYFSRLDFDNDGVITRKDWLTMGFLFVNFEKAAEKQEEHLITAYNNLWEQFMKKAVTDDKERMTVEVFIDSIGKQLHDPELMQSFSDLIHDHVNLMDLKSDGYLQEDEYYRYFAQLGIPNMSFAKEAFRSIDVDDDGKIGIEEFINAFWDFLFLQDEESSNAFYFGPLID